MSRILLGITTAVDNSSKLRVARTCRVRFCHGKTWRFFFELRIFLRPNVPKFPPKFFEPLFCGFFFFIKNRGAAKFPPNFNHDKSDPPNLRPSAKNQKKDSLFELLQELQVRTKRTFSGTGVEVENFEANP